MKKKAVLAFSGGLDTSYCAASLSKEKEMDVHSVFVNTGGFSEDELSDISTRAVNLGVNVHKTLDVTEKYYKQCLRYLIFGNVLKNGSYPLSVSSERVFQAAAIAEYAKEVNADYIAHGSTGAGNDQVRFDLIFSILAPDIEILTPIRDQQLSREEEIKYLAENGVKMDWQKSQYSINQGLWGTTIGGRETLTSNLPLPEDAYPSNVSETQPLKIELGFIKGELKKINDAEYKDPVETIRRLNNIAASFGIGRDIHVGDTVIGIKGRVGFEAPAPILMIKAHQSLEKHVLSKWQIHWKEQLASWYGMMLHEGQFYDPVMRDIEIFLENTQHTVNGTVYIELAPYRFQILGISSPNDLMAAEFGRYGEENPAWSGQDVRGFAKILANQGRIHRAVNKGDKK